MNERISTVMGRFGRFSVKTSARPVNTHTHKELSVLFHLGGPEFNVKVDEQSYVLNPGHMLLLDPWRAQSRIPATSQPCNLALLLIDPRWLSGRDEDDGLLPGGASYFNKAVTAIDLDLRFGLDKLQQLMSDRPTKSTALLYEKIAEFISLLMGRYGEHVDHTGDTNSLAIDFRVRRAFDHLRRSAVPAVKIESLAAGSGMSRSHFFRQFKRWIGVSPQHVVDEERVAYALRVLGSQDVMLSELSDELGFSAPAHFTRFFVQHLGCTPSQFRRNLVLI